MLVEEKTEENKNKTEEKQDNKILEVAKQVLKSNKKALAWTEERKEKQRLVMVRLQASGKGYKGKKKEKTEKHDDDETDSREHIPVTSPQDGDPGVESEFEDEKPDEGVNSFVVFAIIFIAVIFAVLIFFKDTVADFWKGEKHE